ncbi:MAG TPA: exopolysaccharide biosynthesis polyprenyl glycosylphosphotransferase [Opitutaceae bacterium]|nr:exopolysaccharide biosynthesis polyprenyl glycosylphosphotransferase [Opitutaceae bacterium]
MAINPHRRSSLLLLAADIVSVALVFNLVTYLRGVSSAPVEWPLLAPAFILVVSLYLIDGYGAHADMLSLDYASAHLIASFSAALATLLLTFAFISVGFELQSSRAVIVLSFAVAGPFTLAYRRVFYERTNVARVGRNIVFVGTAEDFDIFSGECRRLGTQMPLMHVDSRETYRSFEAVLESVAQSKISVEAIVVKESGRELPSEIPMKLVQLYFDGIPTYTLEIFHQVYWRKIPLYRINPIWILQEGFKVAREPVFERIKRASDIVLSIVGLVVFSPIVAAAAVAIKLGDRGPVFFVQTRIGRHKVPFRLAKLRTMRVSRGPEDPYTRQDDVRVTRIGRLLRSARLDELPQLWNVLRGEMSLIGPRAEWDRLVNEYERDIPCYHFRHLVKPGITGWAQVNYRYGSGVHDTLRKLEYDLYYIRNCSFMLDASIVLKTFHVMLLQKGR